MSGHSKWSTIKHKKAATDAKRGKMFSKHAKLIQIAAREGGSGDPETNAQLATAVEAAKADSVPKDNIDRAVKKGSGADGGEAMKEHTYEGYAPGGVAVMVTALTDNVNRAVAEVRHAFSKNGGKIAESGSVAFQFTKRGVIRAELGDPSTDSGLSADDAEMAAIDAGAVEAEVEGSEITVQTEPSDLMAAKKQLETAGLSVQSAEFAFMPNMTVEISDLAQAKEIMAVLDALEGLDDVSDIAANVEFTDEVLAGLDA